MYSRATHLFPTLDIKYSTTRKLPICVDAGLKRRVGENGVFITFQEACPRLHRTPGGSGIPGWAAPPSTTSPATGAWGKGGKGNGEHWNKKTGSCSTCRESRVRYRCTNHVEGSTFSSHELIYPYMRTALSLGGDGRQSTYPYKRSMLLCAPATQQVRTLIATCFSTAKTGCAQTMKFGQDGATRCRRRCKCSQTYHFRFLGQKTTSIPSHLRLISEASASLASRPLPSRPPHPGGCTNAPKLSKKTTCSSTVSA